MIENAEDGEIAVWLHRLLTSALRDSDGRIAITLPGGSTPFPILGQLAGLGLDWTRIDVWPGDDRIVAEDHPASNAGRIRALLEPLGARLVPLAPEAGSRRPGRLAGRVDAAFFEPLPEQELDAWEGK